MPRRNKSRAQRRNQARALANQARLAAAGLVDPDATPILTRARHQSTIESLVARGSITKQQADAAGRLEANWRASGSLIGKLVATYEPRHHRDRRRGVAPGSVDTARSAAARAEVEGALQTLGPWIAPVIVHVIVADLPAASWATSTGRRVPDALGVLRLGLDILVDFFNRPARDRRPRRDPPAAPAPAPAPPPRRVNGYAVLAVGREDQDEHLDDQDEHLGDEHLDDQDEHDRANGAIERVAPLEQEVGGTLADLLLAAQLGDAADDVLLGRALSYVAGRGRPFGDHLDQAAERLTAIAAARAAPPAPSGHTTRLREPYHHPKLA